MQGDTRTGLIVGPDSVIAGNFSVIVDGRKIAVEGVFIRIGSDPRDFEDILARNPVGSAGQVQVFAVVPFVFHRRVLPVGPGTECRMDNAFF